jgi:hypothetical protein
VDQQIDGEPTPSHTPHGSPNKSAAGFPSGDAAQAARDDADLQRAVVAYRFWYPTVSAEGIFNGNREIGIADNKAMGIASCGPRQVGFTLNSDTPYGSAAFDLSEGPIVIELPAGPYIGLVNDHHQRWITDMGIPGPDAGAGGRYVITPPGFAGTVPTDCHAAASATFKVLLAVRAMPVGGDVEAALQSLRSIMIHPLNSQGPLDVVDISDDRIDSTCLRWEGGINFWRILHEVLDYEPVVDEFRPMHGLLTALGLGKGQSFNPDPRMTRILEQAAHQGRAQLLVSAFASTRPDRSAWNDRQWEWVGLVPDDAGFETPVGIDLEARDRWFAQAIVTSPAMFRRQVGGGSLYWLAARDAAGEFLDGSKSYAVTLPLPVPAKLFWSVTIYDAQTRSQVQADQDKAALRSLFELSSTTNETGSVTLYFGPHEPDDAVDRWLQTLPGRGWFAYIRIYGPEHDAFDGQWRPGDLTVDADKHDDSK